MVYFLSNGATIGANKIFMRMKKIFLLLAAVAVLCAACEKEPFVGPDSREDGHPYYHSHSLAGDDSNDDGNKSSDEGSGDNGGNTDNGNTGNSDNNGNVSNNDNTGNNGNSNVNRYAITRLYSVVMRREIPYPFKAYVLQIEDGNYFYMLRLRYKNDLYVGDKISFGVFSFCPNEIARINGVDVGEVTEMPEYNEHVNAGEYFVATDPIEATVKRIFAMKIRYSLTLWPIDTWFLETTDGNLIYIKKSKLSRPLAVGDRIVYSVYTLFPNEVVTLKKL